MPNSVLFVRVMSVMMAWMETWRGGTSWRSRKTLMRVQVRGVVLMVRRLLSSSEKTMTSVSKTVLVREFSFSSRLRLDAF